MPVNLLHASHPAAIDAHLEAAHPLIPESDAAASAMDRNQQTLAPALGQHARYRFQAAHYHQKAHRELRRC